MALETERLVLRAFVPEDAPAVQELVAAHEVASMTATIPHPYPPGGAAEWIASHAESPSVHFAIVRRGDERLVGAIGIVPDGLGQAEVGYWVGVPYWGNGHASEALRAVVDHGFGDLGLSRIHARAVTLNRASQRVLEKAGMQHEGTLRQHFRRDGVVHDLELYGILREEWSERHS